MWTGNAVRAFLVAAAITTSAAADGEQLVIPGSGNNEYVLAVLARTFNASQKVHQVVVPPSTGSAGALQAMEEKTATIARIGRPLKDSEHRRGVDYIPLGSDAVTFIAGTGVSVKSITAAQAFDIYSGKITNWSELGGKPAPIRAIGREGSDASRQIISRKITAFDKINYSDDVKIVHLDPQMISMLDRYPSSLGFLNLSALGAATTRLVPLALDGVPPSPANLESGTYPLRMDFGLLIRSDALTPAGREFLAFIRAAAGIRVLRENGVLPAPGR